jgi:hypothetical protein
MPRGEAPEWRRRKLPITDELIQASVNRSNGMFDPETGHYGLLVYSGLESRDDAAEYKNSLFRCAKYLGYSVWVGQPKKDADGTYSLEFRAINKAHARRWILAQHGNDRSAWPYDPRRKGNADGD